MHPARLSSVLLLGTFFDPERPWAYFMRMERRMLPVGIQTLGNIRARNCYYETSA